MAEKLDTKEIVAGLEIEMSNSPGDVPGVLVEGISGLAVTNGLVKVNCFQQFMDPANAGKIRGTFSMVLNIPTPQFLQIEAIFRAVADELSTATADAVPAKSEPK
jgi:hypothetical protein